jgi:mitochondrial import inner membrane translocase subunit TIM17
LGWNVLGELLEFLGFPGFDGSSPPF